VADELPAGLVWQKSTKSAGNGACVEVTLFQSLYLIRDSKHREGPILTVNVDAWRQFINSTKNQA
jgi:hypothetical protein